MPTRSNALLVLLLGMMPVAGQTGEQVVLVRDGAPLARVVISSDASEQVRAAAATLVEYVERATAARLPVVDEDDSRESDMAIIRLGDGRTAPPDLDADGFVIDVKPGRVVIDATSDWGLEFGVYELLERRLDVRWLFPGTLGEDVPQRKTLALPVGRVQVVPAFFSRLMSGLRGEAQTRWARFNRMHGRVSFHHNLLRLFPPSKYTASHPEFFPMKDGKTRYLPPTDDAHAWQPCFSEPATVQAAIGNINRYFDEHPEATSYSLGVNDSSGHCRCPKCLPRVPAEPNFVGRANYSDLYYDWCYQVIEGVLKKHPDKWFGCLAYSEVAAPPSKARIHPRLIPYMTYDRMKWIHVDVRAAGEAATEAWQRVARRLGWYDYIYGSPYCLPRVYFHHTAEYTRFGRDHSVRAMYAELYPNWGEGPKPYVFLKLWWNPDRDVGALLDDWYRHCVGPKAAPYLRQYYEIWERFWTRDILRSRWFTTGGQYLRFNLPAYLADVREQDVRRSRQLLEQVIANCQTERQRQRARLLEKAFQYYEASALAYLATVHSTTAAESESQALRVLDRATEAVELADKRRRLVEEEFARDPVLIHPLDFKRCPALEGRAWGGSGLWSLMDWVRRGDNAVRRRVAEMATSSKSPTVQRQAKLMLAIADGQIAPVSKNPSFEQGRGGACADWTYWVKPNPQTKKPVGRMLRTDERAHSGNYSILCDRMYRGGPVHILRPLPPGAYCVTAWVYVEPGSASTGTTELVLTPRDAQGRNLPGLSTKISPPMGRWSLIVAAGDIAAEIQGKAVTHAIVIPIVDGFAGAGKVYWDDVTVYRVDEMD